MGLVHITSWYPNFNGSHFGLPPSEIHRMTGVAKLCELWRIRTGPIKLLATGHSSICQIKQHCWPAGWVAEAVPGELHCDASDRRSICTDWSPVCLLLIFLAREIALTLRERLLLLCPCEPAAARCVAGYPCCAEVLLSLHTTRPTHLVHQQLSGCAIIN